MRQRQGVLLLSGLIILLMSGCGSTSVGTESGKIASPGNSPVTSTPSTPPQASGTSDNVTGTDDSVVSTVSSGGSVSVTVGASQTFNVVFTSSDGKAVSGFAVSGSLGSLPSGWSSAGTFACAAVGPGSGCVLTLTYAPTMVDSGTLTFNCVFVDNAKTARTPGPCMTLNYVSTAANNVVAAASLAGEVDAVVGGGAQALNVNFTTDDGNPATALSVTTSLSSLPSGWSSTASSLSCAIVRVGNGCQLPLSFAPTAATRATLTLNYTYLDNTGATRSGTLAIPYASVAVGTVVGTVSPSGQINAIETTGSGSVAVTFNSIDDKSATNLVLLTDLATLPSNWTGPATAFSCAAVSTGNGCQLHLTYKPTALTSGTFTLRYAYEDASGMANTGLVDVSYAATTDDNVIYTPSVVGETDVIIGGASQSVVFTFDTDDARIATNLQLMGLASLPPGWSSSSGSSFACAIILPGSGCQFTLTYAPTVVASGTLSLGYSYLNNAGETKSGTVTAQYRATANDNLVAVVNPTPVAATVATSNPVTVTFTMDDGNVGTALAADLSTALPPDWSTATSAFACSTVSVGSTCTLTLTYAPTVIANSSLSFVVNYTNNAGINKALTVSIPYQATANDNLVAVVNPTPVVATVGTPDPVTVTFTTDDGNAATALAANLSTALPPDWSTASSSFTCSTFSVGTSCTLALTYTPTVIANSSFGFVVNYTNNAGIAKAMTVTIPYSATP